MGLSPYFNLSKDFQALLIKTHHCHKIYPVFTSNHLYFPGDLLNL